LQIDTIFVSGHHVITEWTLQTTLPEPFYGRLSRSATGLGKADATPKAVKEFRAEILLEFQDLL
jgi:hypothetical protein